MQIPKNKIKKCESVFKKIPRKIAEKFFSAIFISLFVVLLAGGLIFYKYSVLARQKTIEVSVNNLKFKEDVYQKILVIWSEKEKKFNRSNAKAYLNPFKAPTSELTK